MGGAIEFTLDEIPSSHHGLNSARGDIHSEKGALRQSLRISLPFLQLRQSRFHRFPRRFLHGDIQCRIDLKALFVEDVAAIFFQDVATDVFHKIGGDFFLRLDGTQVQRRFEGAFLFPGGDVAVFHHPRKDIGLSLFCPVEVEKGGIIIGRFRKTGKDGRLGKVEMLGALPEITLGRRFNAVSAMTEINIIQVKIQNLVLGKIFIDLVGKDRFFDLS